MSNLPEKSHKKDISKKRKVEEIVTENVTEIEFSSGKFSFKSIRAQLSLSFALTGFLLLLMVGLSIWFFRGVQNQHAEITNERTPLTISLLALDAEVKESSRKLLSYISTRKDNSEEVNVKRFNGAVSTSLSRVEMLIAQKNDDQNYDDELTTLRDSISALYACHEDILSASEELIQSSFYLESMKENFDLLKVYSDRRNYNENKSYQGQVFFALIDTVQDLTVNIENLVVELSLTKNKARYNQLDSLIGHLQVISSRIEEKSIIDYAYYINSVNKINSEIKNLLLDIPEFQEELKGGANTKLVRLERKLDKLHENLYYALSNILGEEEKKGMEASHALSVQLNNVMIWEYVLLGLGLIVAIVLAYLAIKRIVHPIQRVRDVYVDLSKGRLQETMETADNEIGDVVKATNVFVEGLKKTADFANEIGNGELDVKFKPLSNDDILGKSLIDMRDNLKVAADEEKKRSWKVRGLAKFGELLRQNNENIQDFGFVVISELVKYIHGNQGAIYMVDGQDNEEKLRMIGCYADNRRKVMEVTFMKGEGLIGQCWLERSEIYVTDVPENYINIRSGLGNAVPRAVLVVPLKEGNKIYGALEVASFKKIQDFEREFILELAESIASTIKGIGVSLQTQRLLTESKQMTEEMRSQEEELRQTAEEMQATKEDLERRLEDVERENAEKIRELKEKLSKYEQQ